MEKFNQKVNWKTVSKLSIGSTSDSTIRMSNFGLNNVRIFLEKTNDGKVIVDKNCVDSVMRINGYPVCEERVCVDSYTFVCVGECNIYITSEYLYFERDISFDTGLHVELVESNCNHLNYPIFMRSARQRYIKPQENVSVLDPKTMGAPEDKNLAMTIVPLLVSMGLMVVMRMFMGRNAMFVLYSGAMMVVSAGMGVWNYFYQGRRYRENVENRVRKYDEYLQKTEKQICNIREKEKRISLEEYPRIEERVEQVKSFDARLFEIDKTDDDFLTIRIGDGTVESCNQVNYKSQDYVEFEDPLVDYPKQMSDKYRYVDSMPVLLELGKMNAIGFVGNRNKLYQMCKNIIILLATSHYFDDVKISLFLESGDVPYFRDLRWLRNFSVDNGRRLIAYNDKNTQHLLEYLYTRITAAEKGSAHHVVLAYRNRAILEHPISKYVDSAREKGMTFLFFDECLEYVHKKCDYRVFLNNDDFSGYIQSISDGENIQRFSYSHISRDIVNDIAYKLGSVEISELNLENNLTKNISFYQMHEIANAVEIDIENSWKNSDVTASLEAPIGVKSGDEIVYLDIHEKGHGPHGLIAGTTGAGKSEILQTYILSMAMRYHPYEVSFVIIDFKGGGMVNQFETLPHLNGAITNIDGKQIDRSLMSIRAELLKRQELFAQNSVNHIDDYIALYRSGKVEIPLPHLILIVDEFAELKAEQPDFMKELISASRIGRSLGVHLILATQKPGGVVNDQIRSNSNFRICLRVQSNADSTDVIDSPLAAEIREPGRAYINIGNGEIFTLLQSAYSGALVPNEEQDDDESLQISIVDLDGSRRPVYVNTVDNGNCEQTQLEAVVARIKSYCDEIKLKKMQPICLPALPDTIYLDSCDEVASNNGLLSVPLGIIDNPAHQEQINVSISLADENVMIIGSAYSGKTNIIHNIVRCLADTYTANDVNLHIIDCGSLIHKKYDKLCIVSSTTTMRDAESINVIFNRLCEEAEIRKEILASACCENCKEYRLQGHSDMPHIIVIIDNFAVFAENLYDCYDRLLQLCRDGLSVGISFILTGTQYGVFGSKLSNYFNRKIAMHSINNNVYAQLFGLCKIEPDDVPGRFLIELNKVVYEGQSYYAYKLNDEDTISSKIEELVLETNAKSNGIVAKRIEIIPETISADYLLGRVKVEKNADVLPIGIGFDTAQLVGLNLRGMDVLGVLSNNYDYCDQICSGILTLWNTVNSDLDNGVWIIDSVDKELSQYAESITRYSTQADDIKSIIAEIHSEIIGGDSKSDSRCRLLIINSAKVYETLSLDVETSQKFLDIVTLGRKANLKVIMCNIPNANLRIGQPVIVKTIGHNMKFLLNMQLSEQKLINVEVSDQKRAGKLAKTSDAYYYSNNCLSRVRTLYVGEETK